MELTPPVLIDRFTPSGRLAGFAVRRAEYRPVFEADGRCYRFERIPPGEREAALREAFRRVRREVWTAREWRLVAKWEGYG